MRKKDLKNNFAKYIWDHLQVCWIDIYLSFFNIILVDINKNLLYINSSNIL